MKICSRGVFMVIAFFFLLNITPGYAKLQVQEKGGDLLRQGKGLKIQKDKKRIVRFIVELCSGTNFTTIVLQEFQEWPGSLIVIEKKKKNIYLMIIILMPSEAEDIEGKAKKITESLKKHPGIKRIERDYIHTINEKGEKE